MKKTTILLLGVLLIFFVGCEEEKPTSQYQTNITAQLMLDSIGIMLKDAVVGNGVGQYLQSNKDALSAAAQTASKIVSAERSTAEELEQAKSILRNAITQFKSSVAVDKKPLTNAIAVAQKQFDQAVVGNKVGNYPQQAKDEFATAIDNANATAGLSRIISSELKTALDALSASRLVFESMVITTPPMDESQLEAYWPFDGDAKDYSPMGNHHDGLMLSMEGRANLPAVSTLPNFVADRHGRAGRAISFHNTHGGHVEVAASDKLNTSESTLAFWVKYDDMHSISTIGKLCRQVLFMNHPDDGTWGWALDMWSDPGNSYGVFNFRHNYVGGGADMWTLNTGETWMTPNIWIHVTIVVSKASSLIQVYKDAVQVSSQSWNGNPMLTMDQPLVIGAHLPNQDKRAFDSLDGGTRVGLEGCLDNVRIYSKALSAQEVLTLYNTEK